MRKFLQAVRPYIPGIKEFGIAMAMILPMILLGQVQAQTIDTALGGEVVKKGCTLINSVEKSLFLKLFCGSIFLWGVIKFLPTRKDGTGQMIAGIVGFLVLAKFTTIMQTFGMKCA